MKMRQCVRLNYLQLCQTAEARHIRQFLAVLQTDLGYKRTMEESLVGFPG